VKDSGDECEISGKSLDAAIPGTEKKLRPRFLIFPWGMRGKMRLTPRVGGRDCGGRSRTALVTGVFFGRCIWVLMYDCGGQGLLRVEGLREGTDTIRERGLYFLFLRRRRKNAHRRDEMRDERRPDGRGLFVVW